MINRPNWTIGDYEPRPKNKLWLDRNECRNSNTINLVKKIAYECIDERISTYIDLNELYTNAEKVLGIEEENIYFTNGADGAIRSFFEFSKFKGKNRQCILMRPSFAMYSVYAHCYCDEVNYVDYERFTNRDSNQISLLLHTLNNCDENSICVIANPESPMGVGYTQSDIKKITSICNDRNISLLIDCTYEDFADFKINLDIKSLLSSNIFIAKSFSKSWGLSGVRLGYLQGSSSEIKKAKLARPMYEVGALQALILRKALDYAFSFEKHLKETVNTREAFVRQLNELGLSSHTTHCNFIHVETSTIMEKQKTWLNANICYKEFTHKSLESFLRITVPSSDEKDIIIEALANSIC